MIFDLAANLDIENPYWLLVALMPFVMTLMKHLIRSGSEQHTQRLQRYAAAHLLPRLLIRSAGKKGINGLFFSAWLFAALAASNPSIQLANKEMVAISGSDIVVVLDISPSMLATDVQPSRLQRAKMELRDFINLPRIDRLGLVVFSGNVYTLLPLTFDKQLLLSSVELLNTDIIHQRKAGSSLPQALDVATSMLLQHGQKGRAILLLTDGETEDQTAIFEAASKLRKQNIPVFTLGIGTETGAPVLDQQGNFLQYQGSTVISKIDRALLQTLSNSTGGFYVTLSEDNKDWEQLASQLQLLVEKNDYPINRKNNALYLFPYLITLCLFCFMLLGLRSNNSAIINARVITTSIFLPLALVLPLLLFQPTSAFAAASLFSSPWKEQQALETLNSGDYKKALKLYQNIANFNGLTGRGAANYHLQNWADALADFQQSDRYAKTASQRAQAAYNMGNALSKMDRLNEAQQMYKRSINAMASYPKSALNLDLINQLQRNRKLGSGNKVGKGSITRGDDYVKGEIVAKNKPQADNERDNSNKIQSNNSGEQENKDGSNNLNAATPGLSQSNIQQQQNANSKITTQGQLEQQSKQGDVGETPSLWGQNKSAISAELAMALRQLDALNERSGDMMRRLMDYQDSKSRKNILKPW